MVHLRFENTSVMQCRTQAQRNVSAMTPRSVSGKGYKSQRENGLSGLPKSSGVRLALARDVIKSAPDVIETTRQWFMMRGYQRMAHLPG
jgi:hypothetical protein